MHKTIILPVVLYGCETWLLTLREECTLQMREKTMLRRIFGPKRDEVTREWRKLHNEELNDLYSPTDINWVVKYRRMRWAGHVWGGGRGAYWVLVGKPEGKNHLEEPGRDGRIILRWILRKWDRGNGLDWFGKGQGKVAGTCKSGNENFTKCREFLD